MSHPHHSSQLQSRPLADSQPATRSDKSDNALPIPEPDAGEVAIAATDFLDVTEDDNDVAESISVIESVKRLMHDAKKYRSFTALFHLNSLQQFIELWEKYKQNPRIKAPMVKASHTVSTSVGKGPYFARKIRKLYRYVAQFRTLPPLSTGKYHTHPSLLNDERVAQAVRRYLTVLRDGEVRYIYISLGNFSYLSFTRSLHCF